VFNISSGISAHHQELKNSICSIGCLSNLFAATANVGESDFRITYVRDSNKQVWQVSDAACTVLSSWWWAEKPLETCRTLTTTKNIVHVASCWLCLRMKWCCCGYMFCPQSVFCLHATHKKKAITFLYSRRWLVFINRAVCLLRCMKWVVK
jgi:hypothetical protein